MANRPRPTFEKVWGDARVIHGALRIECARWLYKATMRAKPPANIVEIGTFWGRSTSILGQVAMHKGHHLYCVDAFVGLAGPAGRRGLGADSVMGTLHGLGIHFTMMMMPSSVAAARFHLPIDILYVDGDHTKKGVTTDCELWLPKLKVGGWVLFHDYYSATHADVRPVVDALEGYEPQGRGRSMQILRKVSE